MRRPSRRVGPGTGGSGRRAWQAPPGRPVPPGEPRSRSCVLRPIQTPARPTTGRTPACRWTPCSDRPACASPGTHSRLREHRPNAARLDRAAVDAVRSIGCSAADIRHSICRVSATDTGAVLSAISRASARAAGSRSSGACSERTRPRVQRLLRAEDAAGEAPFQRGLHAHQPGQEPARRRLRRDAAAREDEAEARVGARPGACPSAAASSRRRRPRRR